MTLSLRRIEIVVIFLVAAGGAYAIAMRYAGWGDSFTGPATLIGQPTILNQREAVLDALAKSTTDPVVPPEERLRAFEKLEATSAHGTPAAPDMSERLKALEQLSASSR